jgi:predicted ester cyclase
MENPNKSLVRRYLEEVVNTGDIHRVAQFVSPADVEQTKQHIQAVRSTYPDLQVTVEAQIAEGDFVATLVVARGTHKGKWLGIEPTNKPITIEAVNFDTIRDGTIVEHRGAADSLEALIAIGALPFRDT